MLRFLHRKLIHIRVPAKDSKSLVFSPQNHHPTLQSISNLSHSTLQSSLTLSYLEKSCGLSPESALSASKKVTLKTTENPDSVLSLLKSHGLSKTHISKLISKHPQVLSANPDKTLQPKIKFFNDLGFSGAALAVLLSSDPTVLYANLKNRIIPSVGFLKTIVHTNENVLLSIKRSPRIINCNLQTKMNPNLSILKDHGVPESNIVKLITISPRALVHSPERFRETVEIVKETGFNPVTLNFILAVRVVTGLSKLNWERKIELYKGLGWSGDEVLSAFRMQPMCMVTSEKKIKRVVSFFVDELGWKPSGISKYPSILLLSIDKRIVPRCSVVRLLMLDGLVKKDLNILSVLKLNENSFYEKFVSEFQNRVPEVLKAYESKMKFGWEKEGQSYNS
ncbi:Mitochodrial transcription termination factor-related [Cinnamomum micranthum f. kanehirae]|uniref:Mitochodrial transcription termination factor-related n=1 Tax=Cinnamomum micranthum f. kanehirae TaxID=337451 RepID=A0A443NMG2_9MAGN|nr:Mitochodrial transcription termination factor-related [Cinnamomum micranthum f. kanehirae]